MSGEEPSTILKPPSGCSKEELGRFHDMVLEAGEVKAEGLCDRIGRAEILAFLQRGETIIGVGALKRQHPNYIARLFKEAKAKNAAGEFGLELGWMVIGKAHRGRKYSWRIVEELLARAKGHRIYATAVDTNEAVHRTLIKFNFERDGAEWQSQERKDKKLFLFVHKGGNQKVHS